MTKKKRTPAKKRDPNALNVEAKRGEDEAVALARTAIRPTVQAAITLKEYSKKFGDLDLSGLIDELGDQTQAATDGDLGRAEAMLITQAHTLDAIFNNLAQRAVNAEYMNNLDCFLKLALRAQSQCRANCEALSEIKNPRHVAFVKQANIANNQQVNNGSHPKEVGTVIDAPRARENENRPDELLEQTDGERLDTGTTSTAGEIDSAMETVGAVHGREDNAGQVGV
jgi:hypothetical protein